MGLTDGLIHSFLDDTYNLKRATVAFLEEQRNQENWSEARVPVEKVYKAIEKKDWDAAATHFAEAEKLLTASNRDSLRLRLLTAKQDYPALLELAKQLYRQPDQDSWVVVKGAGALNNIAWGMATSKSISKDGLECAETIARWADEATDHNDANIIDTLARVLFRRGQTAEALRLQEKAVQLSPDHPELLKALESYRQCELPK
jgi:tetratricopeptide (TPR) repeat protein